MNGLAQKPILESPAKQFGPVECCRAGQSKGALAMNDLTSVNSDGKLQAFRLGGCPQLLTTTDINNRQYLRTIQSALFTHQSTWWR